MQHSPNTIFGLGSTRIEQFGRAADTTTPNKALAVLDQPLWDGTTSGAISQCLNGQRNTVFFLNAHCANIRAQHRSYAQALARADYVFPDGIGVEMAAKMCGDQVTTNLNGTDLVPALLQEAGRRGLSVFLLGGRPGVAQAAANKLEVSCPGLIIAGVRDGFAQSADNRQTVDNINASGADVVLVAKGVPLQELWIDQYRNQLEASLVIGVGALLDFVSGMVPRAPTPFRKARVEWLYRLCCEPKRMARRYLIGNVTFLGRASLHAVKGLAAGTIEKRMLDIVLASLCIVLLSPILFVIALAIRMDSRGPALFSQQRVGAFGAEFKLFKFRTMDMDAETRRADILAESDRAGLCFKARQDPRVTRVGSFLRKWSLDEVPQIINVFRGDMSFVGPRPALPSEVVAYPEHALGRLQAKPGITGLWQVSGRADIGFEKMIDLDLAYIKARSIWLDLILLALTFRAVFLRQGAY